MSQKREEDEVRTGIAAEDDDGLCLSSEAMAALNEFYAEQAQIAEKEAVEEDWQLSQFWYSKETAQKLAAECISAVGGGSGRIACLSCPTLMDYLLSDEAVVSGRISVTLLEYDDRFARKYPNQFVAYDYRDPLGLSDDLKGAFDVIAIDPPFLADECLVKVAQSVRLLSKSQTETKLIICTGAVMQDLVSRLFSAHRCEFKPTHAKNLGNEFACFTNYASHSL